MPNILNRIYRYITVCAVLVSGLLVIMTVKAQSQYKDGNQTVVLNQTMPESVSPQKISKTKIEKNSESNERPSKKPEAQLDKQVINNIDGSKIKKISKKDYEVLTRIVEAEVTGGDLKSKMMVANVILNRVSNAQFPDTIKEVVFQKNGKVTQFSPISDGRYYSVKVTKETKKAVDRALAGEDNSKGALFFASRSGATKKNMKWFDNNLKPLFHYGGHEYYTTR